MCRNTPAERGYQNVKYGTGLGDDIAWQGTDSFDGSRGFHPDQIYENWAAGSNPWASTKFPYQYNGNIVTNPSGSAVTINIPNSYIGQMANNGNGTVFRLPGTIGNANTIRVMGVTSYAPNGYVVFYNGVGQPFNPNTGQTLGRDFFHFLFH